jgi:hypothetical protein
MSKSKIINIIKERENMSDIHTDFLEELILEVRKDCDKTNSGGVEYVISRLLDKFVDGRNE